MGISNSPSLDAINGLILSAPWKVEDGVLSPRGEYNILKQNGIDALSDTHTHTHKHTITVSFLFIIFPLKGQEKS